MSETDRAPDAPIGAARKWAITASVMPVTVMQVLDVTATNVALPHIQGSLSAGVDEVSWVLTSYLAANAVVRPATGWLAGALGRKRFFLACTVGFTLSSVACGLAPTSSRCCSRACSRASRAGRSCRSARPSCGRSSRCGNAAWPWPRGASAS